MIRNAKQPMKTDREKTAIKLVTNATSKSFYLAEREKLQQLIQLSMQNPQQMEVTSLDSLGLPQRVSAAQKFRHELVVYSSFSIKSDLAAPCRIKNCQVLFDFPAEISLRQQKSQPAECHR